MWVRGSPTHRTGLGGRPFRPQSGKPIKATGAQITPGAGCKDMITVKTLARAIEKRLGGTSSEALAEARTVMSYFGFRTEIIDNAIQPEDRNCSTASTTPASSRRSGRRFPFWMAG